MARIGQVVLETKVTGSEIGPESEIAGLSGTMVINPNQIGAGRGRNRRVLDFRSGETVVAVGDETTVADSVFDGPRLAAALDVGFPSAKGAATDLDSIHGFGTRPTRLKRNAAPDGSIACSDGIPSARDFRALEESETQLRDIRPAGQDAVHPDKQIDPRGHHGCGMHHR